MIPPIAFHPAYEAPLPSGHRFPMRKYGLLAETLVDDLLRSWGASPKALSSAHMLLLEIKS